MRYLLVLFTCVALSGQSTPGYGGLANRHAPGAQSVLSTQGTAQFWMANGDDVTFGNVDFEVCAWAAPSPGMLSSNGEFMRLSGSTWGWGLSYYAALGAHPWVFSINNLSPFVGASNVGVPAAGSWHLVCGQHDSAGGAIGISVDGNPLVTTARSTPPAAGTGGVYVGFGGGGNWDGGVARAGIWSRKLSAGERAALYNNGVGLRGKDVPGSLLAGLLHYWDLDTAANLPQRDAIGLSPLQNTTSYYPGSGGPLLGQSGAFPAGGSYRMAYMPLHRSGGTNYLQYEISWGTSSRKEVIVSGDSLLNGVFNGINTTQTVPAQLAALLGPAWHTNVTAVPGYSTSDEIANLTAIENGLCGEPYKRRVWVIAIGANDLIANNAVAPSTTTGTIEYNIRQLVAARKAAGCTTAVLTLTPCLHPSCMAANDYSGNRASLNSWLLNGTAATGLSGIYTGGASGADFVIDAGPAAALSDPNNTAYYQDRLHYHPMGAWIVAKYIYSLLNTL